MSGKTLVIGSQGQLATLFREIAPQHPAHSLTFLGQADFSAQDPKNLTEILTRQKPEGIINCAAYTAVDKAEAEVAQAFTLNRDLVSTLAAFCKESGTPLIHFSTDFVFDGRTPLPLSESAPTGPLSIYGRSKLAGEAAFLASGCPGAILRTSWLYSEHGNNFLKTIIRLQGTRPELRVVFDQVGTPTYARDLASFVLTNLEALSRMQGELFHFSNEGVASWYDFAWEIGKLTGSTVPIFPIEAKELALPAPRPAYSVLSKEKIKKTLNTKVPYWKESLASCVQRMKEKDSR